MLQIPAQREPSGELTFAVSAEVPFLVVSRIVGQYGAVWICSDAIAVVPSDSEALRWIVSTLTRLGYPPITGSE